MPPSCAGSAGVHCRIVISARLSARRMSGLHRGNPAKSVGRSQTRSTGARISIPVIPHSSSLPFSALSKNSLAYPFCNRPAATGIPGAGLLAVHTDRRRGFPRIIDGSRAPSRPGYGPKPDFWKKCRCNSAKSCFFRARDGYQGANRRQK